MWQGSVKFKINSDNYKICMENFQNILWPTVKEEVTRDQTGAMHGIISIYLLNFIKNAYIFTINFIRLGIFDDDSVIYGPYTLVTLHNNIVNSGLYN